MDTLYSDIDEAKKIAARLAKRNSEVEKATKYRDIALYTFLAKVHRLDNMLRQSKQNEARKKLKQRYKGKLPKTTKSANFLIELTYPTLNAKLRSKYAAVLRFVRVKKKPKQSVKSFVRAKGGINDCVAKEAKLRKKKNIKGKPPKMRLRPTTAAGAP